MKITRRALALLGFSGRRGCSNFPPPPPRPTRSRQSPKQQVEATSQTLLQYEIPHDRRAGVSVQSLNMARFDEELFFSTISGMEHKSSRRKKSPRRN